MQYKYEEWFEKFKPINNHLTTEERAHDGCMFETFGPELSYILQQVIVGASRVWTVLDCGTIAAGYHIVNRTGYIITTNPAEHYDDCVPFEEDEEEEATKEWEIRISTGNTNTGQVGLAFSFRMESEEQPTEEAILEAARDHLDNLDSYNVGSWDGGTEDVVIFTNSANLTEDSIAEIDEVVSEGVPDEG